MHAQGRVTHERHMNLARAVVHLVLVEPGVVLREAGAVTDVLAQSHVMEKPVGTAGPDTGQSVVTGCEDGAHDVVLRIPVPEPAPEEHGEDGLDVRLDQIRGIDVVEVARSAQPADAEVTARTTSVGPQIIVGGERGGPDAPGIIEGGIQVQDVRSTEEWREVPVTTRGKGLTIAGAKVVAHDAATLRGGDLVTKVVILDQILAQQFELGRKRRRTAPGLAPGKIRQVHPTDLQFDGRRWRGLVKLAVSRHIAIPRSGRTAVVDTAVGPGSVHVAVILIGRPGTPMLGTVTVGNDVARVGHGHMPEQEHGLRIDRVVVVIRPDQVLHTGGSGVARHIMAEHHPAVTGQIPLEAGQFGRQLGSVGVVHDQHHPAPILHDRNIHTRVNISIAGVARGRLDHLILIGRANDDGGIDVTGRRSGEGDAASPGRRAGGFSMDRVARRRTQGVLWPVEGDAGRRG